MTAEQLEKIRWLERVKKSEKLALKYTEIYRQKKEKVNSMQKQYRFDSTPGKRNIIEMKIADMLDTEKEMNKKFAEAEKVTEEVHKAIQQIPDKQLALVLNARYMLFQTHEQTAETLHTSIPTVYRLHKQALDALKIDSL